MSRSIIVKRNASGFAEFRVSPARATTKARFRGAINAVACRRFGARRYTRRKRKAPVVRPGLGEQEKHPEDL